MTSREKQIIHFLDPLKAKEKLYFTTLNYVFNYTFTFTLNFEFLSKLIANFMWRCKR